MDSTIIAVAAVVISLAVGVLLWLQINGLKKRFEQLTGGEQSRNLEEIVQTYINTLRKAQKDMATMNEEFERIRKESAAFFTRRGLIRFQAFNHTGGDQSFALALLDSNNNGFVLSSLYGRDMSKIYAKVIENGASPKYKLTEEEQQALNEALQKK